MAEIIATLWPAVKDKEKLKKMYKLGVRVLRFNFPHFNHVSAKEYINIVRETEKELWFKFRLLLDTAGPWIRLGDLEEAIEYAIGEEFKMVVDEKHIDEPKTLYCDYKYLIQDVEIGQIIKIDSWYFDVKVVKKYDEYLRVKAITPAKITSKRHVNLPGIKLRLPVLWQQDESDVEFAIREKFDYIALSFVRNEQDVDLLRNFLREHGGEDLHIVSKIENYQAVNDLSDIIDSSDLIMVARGDLWTEIPVEEVPSYQRIIIKKSKKKNKKVIVATQMLETMIENPIPTRAEVSDIFYAVGQWADFVMLSGETAIWKYPLKCIEVMDRVIAEANKHMLE